MSKTVQNFRILGDPTRLRLLALLEREELAVHELQEIARMGQSRISTHLGHLQKTDIVLSRREGKSTYYRLNPEPDPMSQRLIGLAMEAAKELPEYEADQKNLHHIIAARNDATEAVFQKVAGRFDRSYGPGRSWQAFGHLLLRILPPLEIADLGSGEGILSELLAMRCRRVIAVDNSEKIVRFGAKKAQRKGLDNLDFRLGDLQEPPVEDQSVDLAILSQALHHADDPAKAIREAFRIVRTGGQVMILDLARHEFEQARELYGDTHLGFEEGDLRHWLEGAGFTAVEITTVARESQPPHFRTLLAAATRS